jgi:hypothetical protein
VGHDGRGDGPVGGVRGVELQQAPLGANLKVTRTSADWRLKDGDVTWSIAAPARGAVQLRYALSYVRG